MQVQTKLMSVQDLITGVLHQWTEEELEEGVYQENMSKQKLDARTLPPYKKL